MRAVGLVDGLSCFFPATQSEIGDALGLSTVHVNRSLQTLKTTGLVTIRAKTIEILDFARLMHVTGFCSDYLHLREGQTKNKKGGG